MSRDDQKPDSGMPEPGKMPGADELLAMEAAEIDAMASPAWGPDSFECQDPEWFATMIDGDCTEVESRQYQALLAEDAALAARFASYCRTVEGFARFRAATEGEEAGPFLRARILVALKEDAGISEGQLAGPQQQAAGRGGRRRFAPILAFLGSVSVAAASLILFLVLGDQRGSGESHDRTEVGQSNEPDLKIGALKQLAETVFDEEAEQPDPADAARIAKGLLKKGPRWKSPFTQDPISKTRTSKARTLKAQGEPAIANDLPKRESRFAKNGMRPQTENEKKARVALVQGGKPSSPKSDEFLLGRGKRRVGNQADREFADNGKRRQRAGEKQNFEKMSREIGRSYGEEAKAKDLLKNMVKGKASKKNAPLKGKKLVAKILAVPEIQLIQVPVFGLSLRDVAELAPLLRRNSDFMGSVGKQAEDSRRLGGSIADRKRARGRTVGKPDEGAGLAQPVQRSPISARQEGQGSSSGELSRAQNRKAGDGLRAFMDSLQQTPATKTGGFYRGPGDTVPPGSGGGKSAKPGKLAETPELVHLRGTESELLTILQKLRAISHKTEVVRLSPEKLSELNVLNRAGGLGMARGWLSKLLDAAETYAEDEKDKKLETVKESTPSTKTAREKKKSGKALPAKELRRDQKHKLQEDADEVTKLPKPKVLIDPGLRRQQLNLLTKTRQSDEILEIYLLIRLHRPTPAKRK